MQTPSVPFPPLQVRKHINDLYEDLRDGHNLVSLLEVLSGVKLVSAVLYPPPSPPPVPSQPFLMPYFCFQTCISFLGCHFVHFSFNPALLLLLSWIPPRPSVRGALRRALSLRGISALLPQTLLCIEVAGRQWLWQELFL